MITDILPTLIMVGIVAIFLFLICETTISFVFYFTGFLLIITLINLWYLAARRRENDRYTPVFFGGETLMTRHERNEQL